MMFELTPNEIIYRFDAKLGELKDRAVNSFPEYREVYNKIKTSIEIDKEGYNLYLVDNFSREKVEMIIDYINTLFSNKPAPRDICYAVYEDEKAPRVIFLSNGKGKDLEKALEKLQSLYSEETLKFYNSSSIKEKEKIIQEIQRKRATLVSNLVEAAKKEGFDVKPTATGFSFVPLKDGEAMSEKEYDELESSMKDNILSRVSSLKITAQDILDELKSMENESVGRIKEIMLEHLNFKRKGIFEEFEQKFSKDKDALEYLKFVCDNTEKNISDIYSTSYEEDEDKLRKAIYKYVINVLVDNRGQDNPRVIFEEDPGITNLIGSMEYEHHNGTYITGAGLIKSGSILQANEGCLIIQASSLLRNPSAYYYLKKTLLLNKIKFDYNRGYLELLSLGGLKPEPVNINVKFVLIGDEETYDILYNYDEDFKKIFKVRAEYSPLVENNDESRLVLIDSIVKVVTGNKLNPLTDEAIKETAKYLSRKANDKKKLLFNNDELSRILFLADNKSRDEGRKSIESRDIADVLYSRERIEKDILEFYKDNRIIFNTEDEMVGSINGLSVIDTGYMSFGKPIRITCTCYKGDGNIIDVQKESNLSGNIHSKSINILNGYLNRILGGYSKIPVDFHLSFEQIYGKIDGDSASVAEIVCMISALSKIPIKQNLAVTGSINQFGEVQPIGGVNEKIEGFFNVCKLKGEIRNKGVVIPASNKDDVVLNSEVEAAISKGEFHLFAMTKVEDAVEVLMANDKYSTEDIFSAMEKELKKYNGKK